ncbi:MAG: ABC transporter substrate-binding protein [Vulcanococcus sp.]|uniref:ABC transporter substrate-binding protein n=1 Tax=Vulcanococcus sp. TaxID=2856995 RepID=UPI0025E8A1AB|nr:ABC transporter substrate-binding protein [Vulcanococcus sp.]MBW0166921.1 ABC transporter substrate-binding protein [Vulcanococcus sp.]
MNHRNDKQNAQSRPERLSRLAIAWLSLIALALKPPPAQASEPGISPRAILIGQSAPFSSASSGIAKRFRQGAHDAFNEVNAHGGIHGRQIVMIYRDDAYTPEKTRKNTEDFLRRDNVFALFGYWGTPTTQAALPLIEKARVPLIAPTTGAQIIREPFNKSIFNVRASYHEEMEVLVKHLVRFGKDAIAIVYQNDSFGLDALEGAKAALQRLGLKPIISVPIDRNSSETDEVARQVALSKPKGLLILTAYPPIPSLIRKLRERGSTAQIMTHSNSNAQNLPPNLRHSIGVSQVVPYPWNARLDLIRDYQSAVRKQDKQVIYDFASLEGYIAARVLVQALDEAGANPTREKLIKSLESSKEVDLGDYKLTFSENNHNGSDFVQLTFLMGENGAYIH